MIVIRDGYLIYSWTKDGKVKRWLDLHQFGRTVSLVFITSMLLIGIGRWIGLAQANTDRVLSQDYGRYIQEEK